MSHKIKKATGWMQRLKQLQEFSRPLSDNLFEDTCRREPTLYCRELAPESYWEPDRAPAFGIMNGFHSMEFSNDGSFLVTGNSFDGVYLWPIDQVLGGKQSTSPAKMKCDNPNKVQFFAISPDNRRILSCDVNGQVFIHDSESQNQMYEKKFDHTVMWEMAMAPDDNFNVLASVHLDNIMRIFDLRRNSIAPVIEAARTRDSQHSIMFSPKDSTQLTTSGDGGAQVIDIRTDPNKKLHFFPNIDSIKCTWNVCYNEKGTRLLCRENRQLAIYDIPSESNCSVGNKVRLTTPTAQNDKNLLFDSGPHTRTSANCFVGSRDDEMVAASASDGKVYIWSVPDGRGERTIDQPLLTFDGSRYTTCLRFSPQNCALVSCGSYSTLIKVWTPVRLTNQTDDDR